ncbi:MAG: alpha-glucosidase C-terminal domain-containing protein, partial [Flammeovirgaceae bacterium]
TIQIKDSIAYNKLQSITALMMTLPGVPVIYYGDEIGDPGGNDPDNRRMMRFENLNAHEANTKQIAEKLVHLRRNSLPLVYGDFIWIKTDDHVLAYQRNYFGKKVLVVFNKSAKEQTVELGKLPAYAKTNFNGRLLFENNVAKLTLKPYSFDVITINL